MTVQPPDLSGLAGVSRELDAIRDTYRLAHFRAGLKCRYLITMLLGQFGAPFAPHRNVNRLKYLPGAYRVEPVQ